MFARVRARHSAKSSPISLSSHNTQHMTFHFMFCSRLLQPELYIFFLVLKLHIQNSSFFTHAFTDTRMQAHSFSLSLSVSPPLRTLKHIQWICTQLFAMFSFLIAWICRDMCRTCVWRHQNCAVNNKHWFSSIFRN